MDKKVIKFGDTEIEKHKFHQHKSPIRFLLVKRVLSILLVTKMIKKLRPLCI